MDDGRWTMDEFNLQPLIINQICLTPHFWVLLHKFHQDKIQKK